MTSERKRGPNYDQPPEALKEIHSRVILSVGMTYGLGRFSVWKVSHGAFGSSCSGKVYFVAENNRNGSYESLGNSCTKCSDMPKFEVKISLSDLKDKIEEDKKREMTLQKFGIFE